MELAFRILAVVLAGIAAYFLWNASSESAFVAAVFGAVAFFVSVRFQVKDRLTQREIEREEREAEEELRRKEEEERFEFRNTLGEISADEQLKDQLVIDRERRAKDKVL